MPVEKYRHRTRLRMLTLSKNKDDNKDVLIFLMIFFDFLMNKIVLKSHASVPVLQNLLQYGKFSCKSGTAEKYFQM